MFDRTQKSVSRAIRQGGTPWYRRITVAAAVVALALVGSVLTVSPAYAAEAALTVNKTVDGGDSAEHAPGEEFSYTITVGCDDTDCVNAVLVDEIPAAFAGFEILGHTVGPSTQPATATLEGCDAIVTEDCELDVVFQTPLEGEGNRIGIRAGDTYQVGLTLKVPQDLSPSWADNGDPVVNTATATSDTADTKSDTATVTVTIPITVDLSVGKNWDPANQQFQPGVQSTVTLHVANTSNVGAESLSLQDPSVADDAEDALDSSNPFRIVDFTGFGPVNPPQGATRLTVDAYVYNAGSWSWVTGIPAAVDAPALPAGVDAANVGGLRFTFTDADGTAAIAAAGNEGTVQFTVAQRSEDRDGESLVHGANATNKVIGTVVVPDEDPVSKSATAPYSIGGLSIDVTAAKSIAPSRIPAGTSAQAVVGGKNNSNGPLSSLVLADTDYFTENLTFGGFSAPVTYPNGATGATITWYMSDGSSTNASVANGSTPVAPAAPSGEHLTGFRAEFTGAIAPGTTTELTFGIAAAVALVPSESDEPVDAENTVSVTGTNPAGTDNAQASAPLDVFYPDIDLSISKSVSPGAPVTPGGTAVVQLPTSTGSDSAYVNPTEIVVEDVWRDDVADDFWNAFNPIAIAPTQVIAGSTLTIEYSTDGGDTWQILDTVDATGGTQVYSEPIAGVDTSTITGLRFTFAKPAGFAQGITVRPVITFEGRSTLRDGGDPTSTPGGSAETYENRATAIATGTVAGGNPVDSDEVEDTANGQIISYTGGAGTLMADKRWTKTDGSGNVDTVNSQSGDRVGTVLNWGVTSTGYSEATVSDPNGGEATPASTVFQAFDLKQIPSISFSADSLLKWDTVSAVELYYSGAWNTVPAPGGSWMDGSGFKGYTLSDTESANTTGVRLTFVPNDAARENSTDPLTPPVGSGLATSASNAARSIRLVWELRNTLRVPQAGNTWTTGTQTYNDPEAGTVWNTVGVSGVLNGLPIGPRGEDDNIRLVDLDPNVSVQKTANKDIIPIPFEGDVAPADYPMVDYTVTAKNDSAARASYVRVTDPMPCTDATVQSCLSGSTAWDGNPFTGAAYTPETNPFEVLTLTRIAFGVNAAQVDVNASMVTLWTRAADGTLGTSMVTMAVAQAMTADQLVDVIGVSVVYQGTSPETTGGTIATGAGNDLNMTLSTQLRVHVRSDDTQVVEPFTVDNHGFVQGYDPVLFDESRPFETAADSFELVGGRLDVTAQKTITPTSLLEKDRANPVTVVLRATDGVATVAANTLIVEDTDQDFWSRFGLVSLDSVVLPDGSDLVQVDVQTDGSDEWTFGTPAESGSLPAAVDPATVTGIRFTFTSGDGDVFSHTAPPEGWEASAALTVRLLDVVRGTGDEIPFPSTVDNEVTTEVSRNDPEIYPTATDDATDDIRLETGTYSIDVAKNPAGGIHTVTPAEPLPWTLTFKNSGSGYLTVDQVTDTLPAFLTPDFSTAPAYATSAGGTLSTAVEYSYDADTRAIAFTWPDGGQRMSPGETFTITLDIELAPGLGVSDRATNTFVVDVAQDLAACTNLSGNGQGTLSGLSSSECGTTNFVSPTPGSSLATFKGVKGEIDGELVDGAVNTVTPGGPCITDDEGYYRSPCAANTVVGATDEWKLEVVNSGTTSYDRVTLVEPLPVQGDRMLATGSSRASTYRAVLDGDYGLNVTNLPAGATLAWQVTTDQFICGDASTTTWPSDPTCGSNTWVDGETYAGDWNLVTGLRVQIDFSTTAEHVMRPGNEVKLLYQTVNSAATEALPGLAPAVAPVTGNYAWNQFGAVAYLTGGGTLQRAPVKAGVTLVGGPLQVRKAIDGAAAEYASDEFLFDVTCTVDGVAIDLGANAVLSLDTTDGLTGRIDSIPLGAECTVNEQGAVGTFGESTRIGTNSVVSILTADDSTGSVNSDQSVNATNVYNFGGLSITKAIDNHTTVGEFGPFDFTLECTTLLGDAVPLASADSAFTIAVGETHTVAAGVIPIGSSCDLTEVDADGADATAYTGAGVVDSGDGSAVVSVGSETAVTATNTFEGGTLSVLKTVLGDGAADYGNGPFTASVTCTYGDQTLYQNAALGIVPDVATLVDEVFPVGTLCAVEEVLTGGANEHENPAAVTITGPEQGETLGSVTAVVTNHFYTGSLQVVKARTGEGAEAFGAGPFTVQATCTWVKNGETLTIPLADGGVLSLAEQNAYAASIEGIIVGAECTVVETDAGIATETTLSPEDGVVTITDLASQQAPASVTVTNRFDVGHLAITKVVDTKATVGEFGPFDFTLTCTDLRGNALTLDPADAEFVLEGGETHVVTEGTLPVGSDCVVTETDTDGATRVAYTGNGVVSGADATATIAVDAEPVAATVTNTYDAGTLAVFKALAGDGAEDYGVGPFTASVTCTYGEQVLYENAELALVPDEAVAIDVVFPIGTVCGVEEVVTGGANEHQNPDEITITGPEDGQLVGSVTAVVTNTFNTGELNVVKERTGDGVEEFGTGPFAVQVTCTWVKNDETLTVPLPDAGVLSLSEENDYQATIDGIIVGAECEVVETDAGLATATTMNPEDGIVTITDPASEEDPATVVITNQFDVGQLEISKTVDRPSVNAGDDVVYTVTVKNTGQIDAENLTVADTLPQGASFVSADPEAAVSAGTLTWPIESLAVGETTTFTVTVSYETAGEYVNQATVTNPEGPWRPVTVTNPCDDTTAAACASVLVLSLAATGAQGMLNVFGAGLLVFLLGLLLIVATRRRRAQH